MKGPPIPQLKGNFLAGVSIPTTLASNEMQNLLSLPIRFKLEFKGRVKP